MSLLGSLPRRVGRLLSTLYVEPRAPHVDMLVQIVDTMVRNGT